MFANLTGRFGQFRPRSNLVRLAQIELLLHHTQFQTLAAPFLGLFLVLAFTHPGMEWWSWGWGVCLCLAYGARLLANMVLKPDGPDALENRLRIYLIGLAAGGILWALAPHAVAMEDSDAQQIVGLFAGIVVLVGIVGNFLYYESAVVYFLTWILPVLYSLGFVYVDKFHDIGWTYIGVVLMFLAYAYKCLQVINLPLGETLELNEALSQEKERVMLADRAKSDFLAMMSHELRTPLTAIVGYSEIIRDQVFGPDARDRYAQAAGSVRNAAGLLTDLIDDLLDLSALQSRGRVMKIEALEIPPLIDSAVELLQDTAAKRQIDIRLSFALDLPTVAVDLRSTIQCLTNVLGNAVKYSPDGSEIFIDAVTLEEFVLIKIRDKGIGIPEAELPDVTEPFHRAKNVMTTPTKGVGLGLSITENLMERQGGNLEIESSPDVGTTVTLAFPISVDGNDETSDKDPDDVQSGS